ncbi:MAG: UDP-2,4-diacetamido-2,4,6-trideoxy-beta-L-altropyranose hydrolase, partial [Pseudomonadota bacterium]
MRVAFRVDASSAMGTGHMHRCLALAAALRAQGDEVAFVTRDLGLDCGALLQEAAVDRIIVLPKPLGRLFRPDPAIAHAAWAEISSDEDAQETIQALKPWRPDWLVVDTYAFGAGWHRAVKSALGCSIAAIDDLGDRAMACKALIDHTYHVDHRAKYKDALEGETRLLCGPRFGLLGPAYAAAPRYTFHETVRSIGVFMGGVDAGNHSATALEAITLSGFEGPVEIVATSANPHIAALREVVAARPLTKLCVDLPDLAAFFARHDLQIGAGGGASWERCCIGAPTLLCVIAPNQIAVAPLLAQEEVVALASDPSAASIAQELSKLLTDAPKRRNLALASQALVDGRGAERVALALAAQRLTVRPAQMSDARQMFDWRNHKAIRAVSGTQNPLNWEAHCAWLQEALNDPTRALFVSQIGNRDVGVIRFDFGEGGGAEVSLYCDPDLHGLGLGSALLRAGERAADPLIVEALVMEGNTASSRLFAKSGYRQTGPTRWEKRRDCAKSDATPAAHGLPV